MIRLRALEPADLKFLYTIENDPDIWSLGTPAAPYSCYFLKQYIAMQSGEAFTNETLRLVIEVGQRPVGLVDLFNYDEIGRSAEVGIAILKSERGKGYSSEALTLMETHARDMLNIRMLYARTPLYRAESSSSLFENSGYIHVATLPQWHFYKGGYEDLQVFQKIL